MKRSLARKFILKQQLNILEEFIYEEEKKG